MSSQFRWFTFSSPLIFSRDELITAFQKSSVLHSCWGTFSGLQTGYLYFSNARRFTKQKFLLSKVLLYPANKIGVSNLISVCSNLEYYGPCPFIPSPSEVPIDPHQFFTEFRKRCPSGSKRPLHEVSENISVPVAKQSKIGPSYPVRVFSDDPDADISDLDDEESSEIPSYPFGEKSMPGQLFVALHNDTVEEYLLSRSPGNRRPLRDLITSYIFHCTFGPRIPSNKS